MTKAKNTKRALLASVLSMMLCMAMLIGSTFAWFTDSVTSGTNKIVAGNLDIEVTHTNGKETGDLKDAKNLFPVELWEPGVVSYETFTVINNGTLAFNYVFNFTASDFNKVVPADGTETEYSLKDVIKIGVIEGTAEGKTRQQLVDAVKAVKETEGSVERSFAPFADFKYTDYMQAEDKDGYSAQSEKTFTVVAYWEPNAKNDNDYNVNNGKTVDKLNGEEKQLYIDITVDVQARQRVYEDDSFNNQYDADAKFPDVVVSDSADLKDAMSNADGDIIALRGGTYNMGSTMVTYIGKEFTLIAMDDEKVTINGELAFTGSSKVSIHNIDIYAENGPILIEGAAEFNMYGGSLASGGYYAALITNGGKTRGAKVTLDGVHLIAKRANGTDGCAIYAPGQADYTLKDCVVDGYAVFCAGNVVIEGGSVTYNKSFAINGNAYNTNATDTYDGKQYFDREEALAGLKKVTSGALGLGDALQFDCNRGNGYEKLERVEIRNTKITATSTQDTECVFGIRYIESCVEGDTHETVFVLENIDTTTYNMPSK